MSNSDLSVAQRVETLLKNMTLAEKIGQLNMPIPFAASEDSTDLPEEFRETLRRFKAPGTRDDCRWFAEGSFNPDIGPGGGFFLLAGVQASEGPRQQAEAHNRLQEVALTKTRHKIPLLQIDEGTHGVIGKGHTIFPEGLTIGSTWDMALVERIYAVVAREARAVGIHALSTLCIEPIRDPRLGRNCEGYTEDPYLLSRIAEAIVRGAQGGDISAPDRAVTVFTCFPGQSEPTSGLERGAMELSERTLRDVFLPPWAAAFRAGALGVMATYPSIDGVPSHASEWLFSELLRDELDFEGIVVSEGFGFDTLMYEGLVASQKEAGQLALRAGVDVNITYEDAYLKPLMESVEEGSVPVDLVDRAVRRVLELKFRLGLFENPYVDVDQAEKVVHSTEHQDLALQSARGGIVLLKNEGDLLPLSPTLGSIAVIGPNAEAPINQLGDYTISMLGVEVPQPIVTVLDGIRAKVVPSTSVTHVKGCGVVGDDRSGFAEAVDAARAAEVAIVVVGEQQGVFGAQEGEKSTVGEGSDVASLDLTGVQEDLIRAVQETGTPTVVVLINGRPLSIRWTAEHIPAIVEAWLPGERGGEAVAEILFGEQNPSGRLPITIPRHSGQLPAYYNYRQSKGYMIYTGQFGAKYSYVDMPATPLWEFGYGLCYTTFEYSKLRIEPEVITVNGDVRVSLEVKNTGPRSGQEVVQLYLRDVLASVAPLSRQLRGFQKVGLDPGTAKTVEFSLTSEDLAMLDRNLRWVVEPGTFEVLVGASCQDVRLSGTFKVKA